MKNRKRIFKNQKLKKKPNSKSRVIIVNALLIKSRKHNWLFRKDSFKALSS